MDPSYCSTWYSLRPNLTLRRTLIGTQSIFPVEKHRGRGGSLFHLRRYEPDSPDHRSPGPRPNSGHWVGLRRKGRGSRNQTGRSGCTRTWTDYLLKLRNLSRRSLTCHRRRLYGAGSETTPPTVPPVRDKGENGLDSVFTPGFNWGRPTTIQYYFTMTHDK